MRSARDGSPGVKFPKTMSRLPPSSPTSKLCSYDHLIEFPEVNVFSTILQKSKEIPKMCTIIVSFYQVLQDAIKFRGDEMRLLYLFCSCSYIVVWSWLRRVEVAGQPLQDCEGRLLVEVTAAKNAIHLRQPES